MIGLTYIGQFSSSLCKDAGYGAIASQIEIFLQIITHGDLHAGSADAPGCDSGFLA